LAKEHLMSTDADSHRDLAGLRILIVEDELLVALELETMLGSLGCEVVGPAARLEKALNLAETEELDGAVLDVNLRGKPVYPVAAALGARGIPFIFSTGYSNSSTVPGAFRGNAR